MIKEIVKDGKASFVVKLKKRSTSNPAICVTKFRSKIESLKEAKKIEAQFEMEVMRELISREQKSCSWRNLFECWERALFKGTGSDRHVSKKSIEDYMQCVRTYTTSWMEMSVDDIHRGNVTGVLNEMTRLGKSKSVKRRLLSAINGAYRWGYDNGVLKSQIESPAKGISLGRDEGRKTEILTLNEIRSLLKAAKGCEHPWYPVWAMACLTGMRSGELHALLWTDIDWENKLINVSKSYSVRDSREVKCTKGGYWRDVPINDELEKLLKELRLTSNGRKHVLPRFVDWDRGEAARVLRGFLEASGLTSVKFHTLRACFATQLLRNGIAAPIVMKICGWKGLKTMQYYVRLAGVEVFGATDTLKFIPPKEAVGTLVELAGRM